MWQCYIEYLDELVLDGLFTCVLQSLHYLLGNTEKERTDAPPLLEVKLELQAPDMVFMPSLEQVSRLSVVNYAATIILWVPQACIVHAVVYRGLGSFIET